MNERIDGWPDQVKPLLREKVGVADWLPPRPAPGCQAAQNAPGLIASYAYRTRARGRYDQQMCEQRDASCHPSCLAKSGSRMKAAHPIPDLDGISLMISPEFSAGSP